MLFKYDIFEYIFLIANLLVMKLGQVIGKIMHNIFRKFSASFGRLCLKSVS